MTDKIEMLVATHKNYWMPEATCYLPVQVGADINPRLPFIGDNTGENISKKNPHFNELTAIYWAAKNSDAEIIGLVHYRRYFVTKGFYLGLAQKKAHLLQESEILATLAEVDMILPKPRNYYIESSYSHYTHAHNARDLDETRNIIMEKYPEYLTAFDQAMDSSQAHMFNMFVMKRADFLAYCDWLFDILFTLEGRIDITDYSTYEARVFGFISERLLDVWVNYQGKSYREFPVAFLEKQHWLSKGTKFLKRKFIR